MVRAAVDRGVTLFDTAEAYGPLTNEKLAGEALALSDSCRGARPLGENLGALNVTLTPEDFREIESGYSQITVHGARLSPAHMAFIDADR